MKKRQKPILLVTILIVFVSMVVGMNYLSDPDRGKPDPKMVSDQKHDADLSKVGQDAASKMGSPAPSGPPKAAQVPAGMLNVKGRMPGGRGILKSDMPVALSKPQPTDTMTASGWYNKDAGGLKGAATH